MKRYFLALALCALSSCKSPIPADELHPSRSWYQANDGSPSPISESQALAIAKAAVKNRDHWPEDKLLAPHLTETVTYGAHRTENGAWLVTAHRCLIENHSGNCGYEKGKAAVILIDQSGKVIAYEHRYSDE